MNKRKLTKRGKIVRMILATTGFTSATVLYLMTAWCENGGEIIPYVIVAIVCLIIMGFCIMADNKIFD